MNIEQDEKGQSVNQNSEVFKVNFFFLGGGVESVHGFDRHLWPLVM